MRRPVFRRVRYEKKADPSTLFLETWTMFYLSWGNPTREHRFSSGRLFRFDFAWLPEKVAFEVEGGIYRRKGSRMCPVCKRYPTGGHTTVKGYESNCEKYNLAALDGWLVLRATGDQIRKDPIGLCEQIIYALKSRRT